MKYSSFILTASIWFFTVLCVSAADADADLFSGNVETALQELSNIDQSSNVFVKYFRDTIKKQSGSFGKKKKLIQDAVIKGTEMEKKIQTISNTLKNSTKPLPTELQSELEEIGNNAASELNKLKGVVDVNDIDEMQKEYNEKYAVVRGQMEELAKWGIDLKKDKIVSSETYKAKTDELKTKGIKYIKSLISFLFTAEKHFKTVDKKQKIASSALSNIRNDLTKVQQVEYHLLLSQKDHFKTDDTSLIHSSLAQFGFAIMFGILF